MDAIPLVVVVVPLVAALIVRSPRLAGRGDPIAAAAAGLVAALAGALLTSGPSGRMLAPGLPWLLGILEPAGAGPWLLLVAGVAVLLDRLLAVRRREGAADAATYLAALGLLAGFLLAGDPVVLVAFGLLAALPAPRWRAARAAGLLGDAGLLAAGALHIAGRGATIAILVAATGRLLRPPLDRRLALAGALDAVAGIALLARLVGHPVAAAAIAGGAVAVLLALSRRQRADSAPSAVAPPGPGPASAAVRTVHAAGGVLAGSLDDLAALATKGPAGGIAAAAGGIAAAAAAAVALALAAGGG